MNSSTLKPPQMMSSQMNAFIPSIMVSLNNWSRCLTIVSSSPLTSHLSPYVVFHGRTPNAYPPTFACMIKGTPDTFTLAQ